MTVSPVEVALAVYVYNSALLLLPTCYNTAAALGGLMCNIHQDYMSLPPKRDTYTYVNTPRSYWIEFPRRDLIPV